MMPPDPFKFRRVMGTFATGVCVLTMRTPTGAWGMTANSLTSLSLDPMLLLVCVDKSTRTHALMLDVPAWSVNILGADQESVSRTFAALDDSEERTLSRTTYRLGSTGAPIIEGCISYLECRPHASHDGGDHAIFVGQVVSAELAEGQAQPLVFFRGRYRRLAEDIS